MLFTEPISELIRYSHHQEYIRYFSLIVALDAFTAIPFAYLRQKNKALRFSFIKIINVLVIIGLNFFFLLICPRIYEQDPDSALLLFYSPDIGVGYAFISNLAGSIVTLLLVIPDIVKVKFTPDLKLLKKMLVYAFPLMIIGLAGMTNEVSDKIIFKYLASVPENISDAEGYVMGQLGIYGANYKLAVLMTLFIQMFRYAAEPFFFSQAKEENAKRTYADVMKYFVIFGLLIFLGVTLYIDIFKYFIGPDFWEGLYIVPIVLLANLFLGVFYNLSVWYKLNDLTRFGAMIAIVGAIITIVMNIILVPNISYLGAAWGHFACYLSMVVMSYFLGRKYYKIDYPLGRIGIYFVLAMAIYFLYTYVSFESLVLRYGVATLMMLGFVGVVFLVERRSSKASV
jgi:O-antigen/teichoic acid export membrane protein